MICKLLTHCILFFSHLSISCNEISIHICYWIPMNNFPLPHHSFIYNILQTNTWKWLERFVQIPPILHKSRLHFLQFIHSTDHHIQKVLSPPNNELCHCYLHVNSPLPNKKDISGLGWANKSFINLSSGGTYEESIE